ncbi:MAG: hypothetical protein ABI824_12230 [Acidobacteriota bacterium]
MKTILRRLAKIENARAVRERTHGRINPAALLRERRKRRLLAAGMPYTEPARIGRFNADGSLRTIAEILRLCRQRQLEAASQQ